MIEVLYFVLGEAGVAPVDTTKHASMWVGNLPPGTKAKDVLDLLNPHGKVIHGLIFIDAFCHFFFCMKISNIVMKLNIWTTLEISVLCRALMSYP